MKIRIPAIRRVEAADMVLLGEAGGRIRRGRFLVAIARRGKIEKG
jgi:hypothetical protein